LATVCKSNLNDDSDFMLNQTPRH